ncbi:MAG: hypothetical protein U5K33_06695 [Halofilum sp. (in: g-proteobacteria)]|nr:hypothetical protein [Halofilum sp. (in: g-proteobacteria)]
MNIEPRLHREGPIQRGSVLLQEFIPGNEFDTRVAVIGNRAFAFRRFNRPDDFRASGSGLIDWDPEPIDRSAVRLAFDVAARLDTDVITFDILNHKGELVVTEISYYYEAWGIEECPGHWTRTDNGDELQWVNGSMHPGDAVFYDFIVRLDDKSRIDGLGQE